MTKKEKYKFLLDEELIDQVEYDLLLSNAGDDEPQEAEVEAEEEQVTEEEPVAEEEPTQEIEAEGEESANEEVDEVVEEVESDTEEPQSVNENEAFIQTLQNKIEELEKVNTALSARMDTFEELISKLSVEETPEEDFGVSGMGKTKQGVNEQRDDQEALYKVMGKRT